MYKLSNIQHIIIYSVLSTSIFGCTNSTNNNDLPNISTDDHSATVAKISDNELSDITLPNTSSLSLPVLPAEYEEKTTLEGIDKNENQIRDDLEVKIYNELNFAEETERKDEYLQAINLIKYIQPTNNTSQIIDQHEFYCRYIALPDSVKDIIDMNTFQYMVTDTQERFDAFNSKLKRSEFSTGEEVCLNK